MDGWHEHLATDPVPLPYQEAADLVIRALSIIAEHHGQQVNETDMTFVAERGGRAFRFHLSCDEVAG